MKRLFALATVVICISCKKENINFPQNLYLTKITATSNLRLYINKTEVFDKSTADNFISQANIFNLQNQTIDPASKVTFLSKDTAVFVSSTFKRRAYTFIYVSIQY